MSDQAARFVGSIPENYDAGLGPHIFFDYAEDLAARVAALRPRAVLELAAGTGIVTRRLRDALPPASRLVASDLNPPMLQIAQAKFEADEQVEFLEIDAGRIDLPDESFDAVACQFGVMFFPDKDRAYAEVARVLEPGGSYLFNTWGSMDANPFARVAHRTVEALFPNDPPGFYRVPFSYHDANEIRDSLARAGFARVRIVDLPVRSAIPSAARFAKGLVFGNPLTDEVTRRGGNPEDVHEALTAAIERELGEDLALHALVVHAQRE